MNQQKRHLAAMSIAITLALAILSYAGQVAGRQAFVADSHVNKYICSHVKKFDPGTSLTARAKLAAKEGRAAGGSVKRDGGQIG